MRNNYLSAALLLSTLIPLPSLATITIANNSADVVHLRTDCSDLANCSTTMRELLDWTWGTRLPSAASPLLVDIGPGQFLIHHQFIRQIEGQPDRTNNFPRTFCDNGGHVTFRGAGRDNTIIGGSGDRVGLAFNVGTQYPATMSIINCDNLTFEDMTIKSGIAAAGDNNFEPSNHGILWEGGGSSVWTNVGVQANGYGWIDICDESGDVGKHDWFASSVRSGPGGYYNVGYASMCGDNSFYGGEIIATKETNFQIAGSLVGAAAVSSTGSIAIYGSLVRAIYPEDGTASFPSYSSTSVFSSHGGLQSKNGGTIHMHGGIISARSETSTNSSVFGIVVDGSGSIHTPDTAFGIKASGSGTATRIIGNSSNAKSPFQWPQSDTPPTVRSITGADTFVETDCGSDGNCDSGSNTHPHMMIYDISCTGDPWFNSTLGVCRGVDPNI